MWCAVTATVHFSAAVVFSQSASLSFSRRPVASSTLASNCLANASPLAPMVSSLLCSSLYRRTMRLEIDRLGDTPRSPWMLKESREMPVLDTARHDVVHTAAPRLGRSSGAHRLFPTTIDFIHPLVDRRGPISTLFGLPYRVLDIVMPEVVLNESPPRGHGPRCSCPAWLDSSSPTTPGIFQTRGYGRGREEVALCFKDGL